MIRQASLNLPPNKSENIDEVCVANPLSSELILEKKSRPTAHPTSPLIWGTTALDKESEEVESLLSNDSRRCASGSLFSAESPRDCVNQVGNNIPRIY